MTIPFWKESFSAWDILILDFEPVGAPADPLPICALTVIPSRDVKLNKSKDKNGLTQVDEGYAGAKISGKIRIWTEEQMNAFIAQYPRFNPRSQDGVSAPLSAIHPTLLAAGVQAIYAPKWTFPTPKSADDEWVISFDAHEWFPGPKDKPPSPGVPGPGGNVGGGSTGTSDPHGPPYDLGEQADYDPPPPNPSFGYGNPA